MLVIYKSIQYSITNCFTPVGMQHQHLILKVEIYQAIMGFGIIGANPGGNGNTDDGISMTIFVLYVNSQETFTWDLQKVIERNCENICQNFE